MVRGRGVVIAAVAIILVISVALVATLPAVGAAEEAGLRYQTRIEGIKSDELHATLEQISRLKSLADRLPQTVTALNRRAEADVETFRVALHSEGYYDAEIESHIATDARPIEVTITIVPGPVYHLSDFAVLFRDEPADVAWQAVHKGLEGLTPGKRARAVDIVDAEDRVLRALHESAFPFAKVLGRTVEVDHASHTVAVKLAVDAGPTATFGELEIRGAKKVDRGFIERRVPWKVGEPYDLERLSTLQQRLTLSGLFLAVRVSRGAALDEQGRVPIVVEVVEAKQRSIGVGVRYASDTGAGGDAYWEHRNLFGSGEHLRIGVDVSETERTGSIRYRQPDFLGWRQTLLVDTAYATEDTDAYVTQKVDLSLGFERGFWKQSWARAGIAFEYGPVERADVRETSRLVGLPLSVRFDTSNNLLDPTTGSRTDLTLTPYLEAIGSDRTFVVARATEALYYPVLGYSRLVLAGRASLGSISGASLDDVPFDKRFYAGGGGSIRGYAYQLAGPIDPATNLPIGGRSLVEVGSELRWRITDSIGVVPFIDGGNVYSAQVPDFSDDLLWGAGIGLRYFTVIGPVRLDLAFPLRRRHAIDEAIQFYISLGQAF
jgi:translocation and assembly module TamA